MVCNATHFWIVPGVNNREEFAPMKGIAWIVLLAPVALGST